VVDHHLDVDIHRLRSALSTAALDTQRYGDTDEHANEGVCYRHTNECSGVGDEAYFRRGLRVDDSRLEAVIVVAAFVRPVWSGG